MFCDTVCHSLKNPFCTVRRDHFNEIPDLACNPIRSQIVEAFFDRRYSGDGLKVAWTSSPFGCTNSLFKMQYVELRGLWAHSLSLYVSLETSVRMARVRLRRSALRSSWWSCPISGPRPCPWRTNSARASGGRNWDVCLISHDHMLNIICGWRTAVKLTVVLFSAVLFNMHDTDNDGTITLEEYRHVSLCSLLWTKKCSFKPF